MSNLALITDRNSLSIDYDMPFLLDACHAQGLSTQICDWEDLNIEWASFDAVLFRSPWNCVEKLPKFLNWCEEINKVTTLFNPLSVARWALDKHYLSDLAAYGVPIVPSIFIETETPILQAIELLLDECPTTKEIVVKPTIGSYSRGVKRFIKSHTKELLSYITYFLNKVQPVIIQPYFDSIDQYGETDLIYFDNVYSHAICKNALLMPDGTVNVPTLDFRTSRIADDEERMVALSALIATSKHLNLEQPLLYGRVDLIRDNDNKPMILELDICEPSLNLSFSEGSAMRFVDALKKRITH